MCEHAVSSAVLSAAFGTEFDVASTAVAADTPAVQTPETRVDPVLEARHSASELLERSASLDNVAHQSSEAAAAVKTFGFDGV